MGESALLLVRMVASLLVVGVLLWALAKVARTRGFSALGRGPIHIQAQRALNRSASLVLVKVGERQLLLGVGEQGVQVLAEGDELLAECDELVADLADQVVGGTLEDGGDTTVDITDPVAGADEGTDPVAGRGGWLQPGLLEILREHTVRRGAG